MNETTGDDLVCFRGDGFQAEAAQWDDDYLLKRIYRAWQAVERAQWSEAGLDALDPELRAHTFLIDVEENPRRYSYRFVGAAAAEVYGHNFSGRYLHELRLDDVGTFAASVFDGVVADSQPALFRGKFLTVTGEPYIAERLVLPLSGEGERTDMILGAFGVTEDRSSGATPAAC